MAYEPGSRDFHESNLVKVPSYIEEDTTKHKDRFGFDVEVDENEQDVEGYDYCVSHEVLRKRELKWNRMLKKFDKFKKSKPHVLKNRCRKGIPYSMRGRAWQHLSGAYILEEKNKGLYAKLLAKEIPECSKDIVMIMKDLHRTFPRHELFSSPEGQTTLRQMLTALMAFKPNHGYCQAMAPVVATLLMHMPAESAFWVMIQIMDCYLPSYYTEGFQEFQIDCELFDSLLSVYAPSLSRHMQSLGAVSVVYLLEWYMCIFCRTLPFSCALRIYDMFFCEGPIVMYKTAIAIMQLHMAQNDKYLKFPYLSDFYPALRVLPPAVTHENVLVPRILAIKINLKSLNAMRLFAQRKFKKVEESRQINRMQNAVSISNIPPVDDGDTSDEESTVSTP